MRAGQWLRTRVLHVQAARHPAGQADALVGLQRWGRGGGRAGVVRVSSRAGAHSDIIGLSLQLKSSVRQSFATVRMQGECARQAMRACR